MRVLVAGATGALGRRLVPLLIAAGHSVAGLTRSPAKLSLLQRMGAEAIVADALDPSAIKKCGLANKAANYYSRAHFYREGRPAKIDGGFAATNRLRKEGTDNLLTAARAAGVRRFVAQSFAGWPYAREGSFVKTEKDPLDPNPPPTFRHTLEAIRYLESVVMSEALLEGIVLRYGAFYGPGTAIGEHAWMVNAFERLSAKFARN
jgi:nucleoside-diphosphate-sugar epimerase